MTSATKPASAPTVTLTFRQIEIILVERMGWEPEDATSFWLLARHGRDIGGDA
jgi:hypothetical protein